MIELTELDKEFIDAFSTTWEADEQERAKKRLLEYIEENGNVVRKECYTDEFGNEKTRFTFKNGFFVVYIPRMSKLVDAYPPTYTEVKE